MPYEDDYKMWLEKALIRMNPDWVCDEMSNNEFTHNWCHQYCGEEDAYITPKCLHLYYHHIAKADRKTENCSEKPNNCETCRNKGVEGCEQPCLGCGCCGLYEPKDEPTTQTETQNSNLTFEKRTMRDCYNCKRYETEDECIECKFEPKDEPTISKMEQVDKDINVRSKYEPKICDTCRYYNSNIPCGSTPSACKEADKFAEEFVDGLNKLKPKDEPQTESTGSPIGDYRDGVGAWQTDCPWK